MNMEIAKFYCGPVFLVGVCLGPVLAALGWLVCKLRKKEGLKSELLAIVIGLVWLAALAMGCILVPSMLQAQWEGRIARARSRLGNVGLAIKFYVDDNDGRLPPTDGWAAALVNAKRPCDKRCFFLPVPLGSDDASRIPDTDYRYTGRKHRIPPEAGIDAEAMLLWTKETVAVPRTGETPYRQIRLVLMSDYHAWTISEDQFQRINRVATAPRQASPPAPQQTERRNQDGTPRAQCP